MPNRRKHPIYIKTHPLFKRYQSIKTRCYNPKAINWHIYGGRGIKMCDRWKASFVAFCEDMAPSWRPGLTIERIDNNQDYSPGNCRWATPMEQNRNQSINVWVDTPWGRMIIPDAAAASGINKVTLYWRHYHGKPLFAPVQPYGRKRFDLDTK